MLLEDDKSLTLKGLFNLNDGDALFFSCAKENEAAHLAGKARVKIATDRGLIEENTFKFCWVVDYPMFEKDDKTGNIEFSHNPFLCHKAVWMRLKIKTRLIFWLTNMI